MVKTVKLDVNKFDGLAITVDVRGGVEEYAMSFLHIFNNVRESESLFKVENWRDNRVTVYCKEESRESLVKYLKNFGEIESIEKVLMYQIEDTDELASDEYEDQVIVPYFGF